MSSTESDQVMPPLEGRMGDLEKLLVMSHLLQTKTGSNQPFQLWLQCPLTISRILRILWMHKLFAPHPFHRNLLHFTHLALSGSKLVRKRATSRMWALLRTGRVWVITGCVTSSCSSCITKTFCLQTLSSEQAAITHTAEDLRKKLFNTYRDSTAHWNPLHSIDLQVTFKALLKRIATDQYREEACNALHDVSNLLHISTRWVGLSCTRCIEDFPLCTFTLLPYPDGINLRPAGVGISCRCMISFISTRFVIYPSNVGRKILRTKDLQSVRLKPFPVRSLSFSVQCPLSFSSIAVTRSTPSSCSLCVLLPCAEMEWLVNSVVTHADQPAPEESLLSLSYSVL